MKKASKDHYKVRNWPQYNQALVKRGSLTLWIEESVLESWQDNQVSGEPGRPRKYHDGWIELLLRIGMVYRLPLRQLEGLAGSLVKWLGKEGVVAVPDYSTLSRRRTGLSVKIGVNAQELSGKRTIAVDSTGLKVYGEGEWKVRQHGVSKRRTWRKLHLAIDTQSGMILAVEGSPNSISDDQMMPILLENIEPEIEVEQVCADGGYDRGGSYQAIARRKAKATIPPRKGARIWQHGNTKAEKLDRDQNPRRIRKVDRKQWKKESGYHQRSKAETTMFRYKRIIGHRLSSRLLQNQIVEMKLGAKILNTMSSVGMPDSFKVSA